MARRLHVLQFSHFCERARWALQHAGLEFEEVPWATGVHRFLGRRLDCASTSVPILETEDAVIQGSDHIADYCGIRGFDGAVEERFENRIGPLVRQYIYSGTLFHAASSMGRFLFEGLDARQRLAGRLMWPVTRRVMIAMMDCRPDLISKLETDLEREFNWFENRLQGRPYLSNDGFGRADITAASLLAPLARPRQCPIFQRVKLPLELEQKLAAWEERPAIAWARRTYERRRFRA
jgi:glutathione S-transferase